jgi:hypothetical protein
MRNTKNLKRKRRYNKRKLSEKIEAKQKLSDKSEKKQNKKRKKVEKSKKRKNRLEFCFALFRFEAKITKSKQKKHSSCLLKGTVA